VQLIANHLNFYSSKTWFESQIALLFSNFLHHNTGILYVLCGSSTSVGRATDYGLDSPGSNPGGDEIFRPSKPALGPTQSPVNCVPGLSRG